MKFQPSYICSEQKRKQHEKRINTREKFQSKLEKWSKKKVNSFNHLCKINEKIRQKQLPAKLSLLLQSFAHKINDKIN